MMNNLCLQFLCFIISFTMEVVCYLHGFASIMVTWFYLYNISMVLSLPGYMVRAPHGLRADVLYVLTSSRAFVLLPLTCLPCFMCFTCLPYFTHLACLQLLPTCLHSLTYLHFFKYFQFLTCLKCLIKFGTTKSQNKQERVVCFLKS